MVLKVQFKESISLITSKIINKNLEKTHNRFVFLPLWETPLILFQEIKLDYIILSINLLTWIVNEIKVEIQKKFMSMILNNKAFYFLVIEKQISLCVCIFRLWS